MPLYASVTMQLCCWQMRPNHQELVSLKQQQRTAFLLPQQLCLSSHECWNYVHRRSIGSCVRATRSPHCHTAESKEEFSAASSQDLAANYGRNLAAWFIRPSLAMQTDLDQPKEPVGTPEDCSIRWTVRLSRGLTGSNFSSSWLFIGRHRSS